ncbi:MAG: Eco57I restriction-modification methylase domain-containing protein [Verrucomicrobia bacterium]|nr:Eco57I restriction-modification methylase domain-containing protein [Verrucomicrobiota bacterium]
MLLNEKDFTSLEKNGFVHQNAKRIADLLDAVKICDPAIGSGAFPIGLLHEILWTRLTLNWELNTPEERAKLKRRIIQNSIHGVDLDPGAVEIARLRFWLALVVDEDQPRPLPNLDYKIHRADSLIEYIRGEPVQLGKVNAEDKRTHGAIQSLIAAKAALFTAQKVPEKRAARFSLYRALAEVAMAEFTWLRNEMGLIAGDAERAAQLDHGLKEFGHRIKLIDSVAKESTKTQDLVLTDLRAWFDDDQRPTFLWQLHFGEVFEAGGFDIIIGNPPFRGGREWRSDTTVDFALLENRYSVAQYQFDIYALFWELCVQLAKDKGSVTLVTPNTWLNNQSTRKLRAYLLSETSPRIIVDCTRTKVFENAVVLPIITQVSKNDVPKIVQIVEPTPAGFIEVKRIDPRYWNEDYQKIINISLAAGHAEIRTKLEVNGSPLMKHATVKFGIKLYETGKGTPPQKATDAKNHIFESENKDSKDHRPYLEGKDVVRYTVGYKGRWLRYGSNLAAPRRAEYFEGPRLLFRRIVGERLIGTFTDQDYVTSQRLQIVIPHVAASAKWLLAQLNSSLIAFYFRSKYNRQDKTFPEIRVYELESLPVKTPPSTLLKN